MLKIVIAGAGKLGVGITELMLKNGHEVRLIETNLEKCSVLATRLSMRIINGNCTDLSTLKGAGTQGADVFIAVTGRDEDNLIACQLARSHFGAKKTISRANNPNNKRIMKHLGVDYVICSSEEIAKLIELEADSDSMILMASLNSGKNGIYEFQLPIFSKCVGKRIMDIELPKESLIVSIEREHESIIPNGSTVLQGKDRIILLCKSGQVKKIKRAFSSGHSGSDK